MFSGVYLWFAHDTLKLSWLTCSAFKLVESFVGFRPHGPCPRSPPKWGHVFNVLFLITDLLLHNCLYPQRSVFTLHSSSWSAKTQYGIRFHFHLCARVAFLDMFKHVWHEVSSSELKSLLTPHNTIKRVTHIIPYASSWVKTLQWFFSSVISHIALILAVIPFQGAHKTPSGTPVSRTNRCVVTPHLSLSHCGVCLDGVKQWYCLRHNDITAMWCWMLDLFSHSHPFFVILPILW